MNSEEEVPKSQNLGRSKSDTTGQATSENKREEIKKLLATKDFYEILGVSKTATKEEITKAYRKLALKFHPDKNKETGADEAFKRLAQAYDCLGTEEKRRKYDEFGNEEPEQHYRHYRQYFNEDISPDDIFQMFFGNAFFQGEGMPRQRFVFKTYNMGNMGMGMGRPQRQRAEHRHTVNEGGFNYLSLLQCLPILIIILVSLGLNFNFTKEEPLYSMTPNMRFPIPRYTTNLKIQYFVDRNFESKAGSKAKIVKLEEDIEKEHIGTLQYRCEHFREKKRGFEKLAEFSQNAHEKEQYLKRAQEINTEACDKVNSYKINYPRLFK